MSACRCYIFLWLTLGSSWVLTVEGFQNSIEIIINHSHSVSKQRLLADAFIQDPHFNKLVSGEILKDLHNSSSLAHKELSVCLESYLILYLVCEGYPVIKPNLNSFVVSLLSEDPTGKHLKKTDYYDEFSVYLKEQKGKSEELTELLEEIKVNAFLVQTLQLSLSKKIELTVKDARSSPDERKFHDKLYKAIDEGEFSTIIIKYADWNVNVQVFGEFLFRELVSFQRKLEKLQ